MKNIRLYISTLRYLYYYLYLFRYYIMCIFFGIHHKSDFIIYLDLFLSKVHYNNSTHQLSSYLDQIHAIINPL